jgi:hypothetical protein
LPAANDAPFNSRARQHEPTCLQNTRVDLLQDIHNWADEQDRRCIYWLSGLAGTGKSTIARTIARKYFEEKRLAASFFFARGGGDMGNASKFVISIAIQLARSLHALRPHIFDIVSEYGDMTSLSLPDQWQMLVLSPLSKLEGNFHRPSLILVVDALDECDDNRSIKMIVQLLADVRILKAAKLRVFLTSRPEIPIRYGFSQLSDSEHKDFILHNISQSVVDHDISIFLKHNLKVIAQERSLPPWWPGEEVISSMVRIASGLFIWAATACKFISEGQRFASKRLDTILKRHGSAVTAAPEKHLDDIYFTVLEHSISLEYTDEEKDEAYNMLREILGTIAVLSSPLSVSSLKRLLCLAEEDINQTLEDLHSVLDISNNENQPLRLHHPSFRDFLLNKSRNKNSKFSVDEKQTHRALADHCLRVMSSSLKQDICAVRLPGALTTDTARGRIDQCLPLEVQYACLYWIQHLQKSGIQVRDNDKVHQFLKEHLLHWLETLGWIGRVPDGLRSIVTLESIALVGSYNPRKVQN